MQRRSRTVMKMESTRLSGGLGSFISMMAPKKVHELRAGAWREQRSGVE
jgi:hypothetical protein